MTHLGEPCDICGDVGFEEYITTCFKCKIAREHCYCMRKVLLTVPEIWICEKCQSSIVIAPKSVTAEHVLMVLTSTTSDTESPSWSFKNSRGECHLASTLIASKTLSPSRFLKKEGIADHDGSSLGWSAAIGTMHKSGPTGFKDTPSMCSVKKLKTDHDLTAIEHSKPHGFGARFCSITQQNAFHKSRKFQDKNTSACQNKQKNALMPVERIEDSNLLVENITKSTDCQSFDALPIVCSVKPESMAIVESNLLNTGPSLVKTFPNYPTLDPTWCGSFEILNLASRGVFFDGFLAHPPGKVHRKALEFSKRMPGVLSCMLLPGSDVWMDVFHDEHPNMEDVALYFFPGSLERSKQQYIRLLGHMEVQDLVLKSCIEDVELLIFSSTRLHAELCGSQKNFLWGVYRRLSSTMRFPLLPFIDMKSQECTQNFDVKKYLSEVKTEQLDSLDVTPKFF